MNIGDVLVGGWKTIWKHKVLWIFGILAGCATGSYGASNGGVTYQFDAPVEFQNFIESTDPALLALYVGLMILIGLVLLVLVVFLSTVGRIGLIRGAFQSNLGTEKLTFGGLFSGSTPYFWRVFGLTLLVSILSFVTILGIILVAVAGTIVTLGLGTLCLIPLLCLLIPAIWMLGIFIQQSVLAVVVEDKGVMDGLQRGWQIFKEHLGDMLILGLIFLLINVVVTFILIKPLIGITVPVITGFFDGTESAVRTAWAAALVAFLCYTPLLLLLNGILRAYFESAWTLNYTRYLPTKEEIAAELEEPIPSPS